jgi:hypothetical protein
MSTAAYAASDGDVTVPLRVVNEVVIVAETALLDGVEEAVPSLLYQYMTTRQVLDVVVTLPLTRTV